MPQFVSVTTVEDPAMRPSKAGRDLFADRFRMASLVLAGLVAAAGGASLAGWWFDVPALTFAEAGLTPMRPDTAVALVAMGLALFIGHVEPGRSWRTPTLHALLGLSTLFALAALLEHFTGRGLHIEALLGGGAAEGAGGHMALTAAVGLLLLSAAIWAGEQAGGLDIAQAGAGGAALVATFDAVGYVFGLPRTVDPGSFGVMALPTAVSLVFAAGAVLFTRPTEGVMEAAIDPGPGGLLIRRLLPVILIALLLIAWTSWYGVSTETYSPAFAITLVVTLSVGALGISMLIGSTILRGFEERRLAAEASRVESEARLQRAVFESPVPIVIHDHDAILNMSRAWSDVSGYSLDDAPTLGDWIAKAHRDQPAAVTRYFRDIGDASETVKGGEFTVRTVAGDERIWEFSSTPLEPPRPEGRLFVTTGVDVTDRIHAERDLRRANEELEQRILERTAELTRANDTLRKTSDQLREQALLLDLVRDGILVRDLYGTIVYWSQGAIDMYGYGREAALGKVSHQLLATEYPIALADIEAEVRRTGSWEGEVTQTTSAGRRLTVESRWTLTRTERGQPEGYLEVNRDITARKRADDSLRDSELRFRAVAESAIEGIVALEATGTIRYWNPGAERVFGLSAAEAVGLPITQVIPDPTIARHLTPEADRGVGARFETAGRREDGVEVPLEVSLSSWLTSQGSRVYTCIIRDITSRKQTERALEAKAEELARSNQELEQFAYVASHDLQEPLRMVSNYTQLLGRRYRDKLDDDAAEFIDFAVDGAKRMQELIHALLQYARVGTRGKEFKSASATRIVADALANLTSAVEEANAEVVVDPLPTVTCDATQIAQVFQNLIGNAVKFRRSGHRPVVRVSASKSRDGWTFAIQDNGIGIEQKYFDRIFQMFQRLHTRTEYPGTGIGLALCKKIVERHGGRMHVESEPGRGTTFSFTLPHQAPRLARAS